MNKTIKSTLILTIIALFSGVSLASINFITFPKIEALNQMKQERALSKVLPDYTVIEEKTIKIDEKDTKYWIAQKELSGKKIYGYAFISAHPGYSGDVEVMLGINQDFKLEGIFILQQTETPGLGSRCAEILSNLTFWDFLAGKRETSENPPWFQEQFKGLDLQKEIIITKKGNWNPSMQETLVKNNEITSITGATITTTAVKVSIEKAINSFKDRIKPVPDGE